MPTRRRSVIACALLISSSLGCDGLFSQSTSTIKFFATHSGTPDDAGFPQLGEAGSTRVFTNDLGWEIALDQIYVTTANVELIRCEENEGTSIEMFWGTCPEDFIASKDRETLPLGAVTIDDGSFCGVDVVYSPYTDDGGSDQHTKPSNSDVLGKTVLMSGIARRPLGDGTLEQIPFQLKSGETVVAHVDISELQAGGPVRIDHENFARNLTVLKTYDKFFEGVDFSTATDADIEAAVLAGLELDTRMYDGATIAE